MKPVTVWFNKTFSGVFNAIESIREAERAARAPDRFRIIATHTHPDFAALQISDVAAIEPSGLPDDEYVEYCLGFARQQGVDVFVPGRGLQSIVQCRSRFEALGVTVLAAADAATLDLLEHKGRVYEALQTEPALAELLPEYEVVNDLAGFDAAYADLRGRQQVVCFKPAVAVYAMGFHVVYEHAGLLDRLLRGEPYRIHLDEARRAMAERDRFLDLLVMEHLPGPERSVDCLAKQGELIRCVVRLKPLGEGGQTLEANPALEEIVRRLTRRLNLNGLFNAQFRDSRRGPRLLEINPRMSGGLHLSCRSGVAFPYWAVRLALGTAAPQQIPLPRTGVRVREVSRVLELSELSPMDSSVSGDRL